MDFTFSEEQQEIGKVVRQICEQHATKERLAEIESQDVRFDAELWTELAATSFLGVGLPEEHGGSGGSFLELATLLYEMGWSVAPVPAYATLALGAQTIARFGSHEQRRRHLPRIVAGKSILSAGLMEANRTDPSHPATRARRDGASWRIEGRKELVPAAQLCDHLIVPAATGDGAVGVFLVETASAGVEIQPVITTSGEPHADVILDGCAVADGDVLGDSKAGHDIAASLHAHALVGLCAVQVGVCERALRLAAEYTSKREQFGRPIGSFQAVQQRMADAFVDVEAMRWTMWQAAWRVAQGLPAAREAAIAKFWTCEAGARVVATAQQVHGGIGIDLSYPLFRYFLTAKQLELSLGSAPQNLAWLGARYTQEAR